jgi:hypothetical protein
MSSPPRSRSLRARIVPLLLIPLTSLTLLWGYVVADASQDAVRNRILTDDTRRYVESYGLLAQELGAERLASVVFLGTPDSQGEDLRARRLRSDAVIVRYKADTERLSKPMGNAENFSSRTGALLRELARLTEIRRDVDRLTASRLKIIREFDPIFAALSSVYDSTVVFPDRRLSQSISGAIDGGRALERMNRENLLVASGFLNGGRLSREEWVAFAQAVAEQRELWSLQRSLMPGDLYGRHLAKLFSGPEYQRFRALEDLVVKTPSGQMPFGPDEWGQAAEAAFTIIGAAHYKAAEQTDQEGEDLGRSLFLRAGLIGGGGLLAVVLSIFLSIRFARSMLGELLRLRDDARELADGRLPDIVARLRSGERVDLAEETPLRRGSEIKEVDEVSEAFAATQRTAVAAAVGEAELRRGAGRIFENIARRNHSLLHRQLLMLDRLESRAEAGDLAELFKLDHLTTRMRRHAESLIILSGTAPVRGWKHPIRMIDVLRAAVAEIEQYTRVSVTTTSEDGVTGSAATDVIHLLAELIENAASFSPPATEVVVSAGPAGNGCVVEIEDRGLGMTGEAYERFNAMLADPPEPGFADTDQLGLFVAARLAARQGIKVMLRPSPFGGVTAIVLIPHEILVPPEEAAEAARAVHPGGLRTGGQGRLSPSRAAGLTDPPQSVAPPDPDTGRTGRIGAPPHESAPVLTADPDTHAGLPRRTRGTNMASSLRDGGRPEPVPLQEPLDARRSPEQARSRMAAIQRGWREGREADVTEAEDQEPTEW